MHHTMNSYLVEAHRHKLEAEAAEARLAKLVEKRGSNEPEHTRWGIHLPHRIRGLRRGPATGATTA
jgi:hypothetical protein